MTVPIIQGYRHPPEPIRGKFPCVTTNLAHRTSSYGLPHILALYEKDHT